MSMSRKSPAKKGQHLRLKQKLTEKFVQKYGSRHRKVIQSELNALFRVRKKAITTKVSWAGRMVCSERNAAPCGQQSDHCT